MFLAFSQPLHKIPGYKLVKIEKTPIESWHFQAIKIGTAVFILH